jgi:hypothetical protein
MAEDDVATNTALESWGLRTPGGVPTGVSAPKIPSREQQLAASKAEAEQQLGDVEAHQGREADLYRARLAAGRSTPAAPNLQDVPKAPQQQFQNPIQAFQNPMVLLAVMASAFTRAPMTAALNAGAAAMKGFHDGDKQVMEQKRQEWEDKTKEALDQNKIEMERYKAAWEKSDRNVANAMAALQGEAAAFKNDQLKALIRGGYVDEISKYLESQEKAAHRIEELMLKLEQSRETAKLAQQRAAETQRHNMAMEAKSGAGAAAKDQKARDAAESRKKTVDDYLETIDSALEKLDKGDKSKTGVAGGANRLIDRVTGALTGDQDTSVQDFQRELAKLKNQYNAVFGSRRLGGTRVERDELEQILPGEAGFGSLALGGRGVHLGPFSTNTEAKTALANLKARVKARYNEIIKPDEEPAAPAAADVPSGGIVIQDGVRYRKNDAGEFEAID